MSELSDIIKNWDTKTLEDEDRVYDSKDAINRLIKVIPLLGEDVIQLKTSEDGRLALRINVSGTDSMEEQFLSATGTKTFYLQGGATGNNTGESLRGILIKETPAIGNAYGINNKNELWFLNIQDSKLTAWSKVATTLDIDTTNTLVNSHINNKANPHTVTADQVGAYTKGEVNAEFNNLKDNLQNLALGNHWLTYKSVSVTLAPKGIRLPTADFEFKHLANMGVSATFAIMLNVTDKNDPNVQMPDDTIITKAISEATLAGVPVTMLKPHIGTSFTDNLNRTTYEPSDWTAFWKNWQNIMLHYAGICDANKIPILCLGCEQYHCTDASMMQQWGTLTAAIRSQYPNLKLTYAAVGGEYFNEEHAQIAKYLDFMGANFYPSYTYKMVQHGNAGGISIDELARAFYTEYPGRIAGDGRNKRTYHEMVDFYQEKYHVQTFVTETGVMPTDDGLAHLISDNEPVWSDPTQQTGLYETPALAMEAFFNGLAQNPNIIGFAWWSVSYPFHFFNALGDSVAEDIMKKYVKGGLV